MYPLVLFYFTYYRRVCFSSVHSEVLSVPNNNFTLSIVNLDWSIDRGMSAETRLEDRGVGAYNRRTLDIVDERRRGGIRAVHNCQCIVDINLVARSYRK